ncbi:DNA helicase HerA, contains HAS-barrel and ATPase domains [Streptomyces sp. yr375]|uniref:ATP-binding protein n=1 Tax=Streptomyces sp. yr375 TaxID=1761906 RepID=UPI0008D4CADD|nr:ATP-binding protein [Streptomyces sp. yr375]SEQ66530.1 DNA helicase HerA, contains HAS-barrel and ATPase domains [Streptomyces sp. yr375]
MTDSPLGGGSSNGSSSGSGTWQRFASLEAALLREVPRQRPSDDRPVGSEDGLRAQRLAALVSAHHAPHPHDPTGGAVLVGWARRAADGPLDVLVGGGALLGGRTDDAGGTTSLLRLPAGARGQRQPTGTAAALMASFPCWSAVAGVTDGLLVEDESRPGSAASTAGTALQRPTLEDCLLGVWQEPFAWLVFAEPVPAAELDELTGDVADERRRAQAKAEGSPEYAIAAARLERRHKELAKASATGLWRIRLLAGGRTPEEATRVAALLCASADLEGLPYALRPTGRVGDLPTALGGVLPAPEAYPFHGGSDLLAALARPPAQEIPGVRFALRPEFDVTPETAGRPAPPGAAPVRLGSVLDRNRSPVGDLDLTRSTLNRHTFVCGATGGGKSQTVRGLLESATHAGIPWLVVEPAKAEYRFMSARLGDTAEVVVIKPGDPESLPAGLNPLEPSAYVSGERFPLQTHLDMVRALFLASFDPQEPFPQVLSAALTRCYEDLGWDLTLGEPTFAGTEPRYPTLEDLEHTALQVVLDIGYGKEVADNVQGFIKIRLASLRLGTTGRFLEGGRPLDFGELLKRNVVFEIEDVGDDKDKAFLMGTILIRLVEYLRMEQRVTRQLSFPLRHLTVFEEAHRLLRRAEEGGASAHAVEMFAGLLAEIRAYGEGLVIADQIPSKLLPDVIKNTAAKVVHRLPAQDDREAVGATMNITRAQSEYLVTLRPGEAAVFTDGMDYPLLVRMRDGTDREDAGAIRPASAAGMTGPRSRACAADCSTATPCTLRDLRRAQRLTEQSELRITLWAEMSVAAHLLGWTTPLPGEAMRRELDPHRGGRLLDCAIGQAVEAAVHSRVGATADPGALSEHVAEAMRAQLDGRDPCPVGEPRFKARKGTRTRVYYHGRYEPSVLEKIVGCGDQSEAWTKRFGQTLSCFERRIRKPMAPARPEGIPG